MKTKPFNKTAYLNNVVKTQSKRLQWWREARFGMFVHWGLYSQIGRNEWVMNLERIPASEYEPLADSWHPKPGFAREWAALAKRAGMKYMVLTTKHHEGFCLWDTKQTEYNAVKRGPGRDLVREYVEAAREAGLRVGFYYSLMDWHHPDGIRCMHDEDARKRFTSFTRECVRELMTNYGKIDILWYDVSWPLATPEAWESYELNAMVRKLQPEIIINDRSQLAEDFGTPEEHITAATGGRAWEACMTFNGSWGWQQTPPEDWHSVRKVLDMLRTCTAGAGNLLLNIGPLPDGSVPNEAIERLDKVGQWLDTYGEIIYGDVKPVSSIVSAMGNWTRKRNKVYYWCSRWPGEKLALGAIHGKLLSAKLYPNGPELTFNQQDDRLVICGLPAKCPDSIAGVGVVELTFKSAPVQYFNMGPVVPEMKPVELSGKWVSPIIKSWQVSALQEKNVTVANAPAVSLSVSLGWHKLTIQEDNSFLNIHSEAGSQDGILYLGNIFEVPRDGIWRFFLGHDGGCQLFFDGKSVLTVPDAINPAMPGRSFVDLNMTTGQHELIIAFDTAEGRGWGIFSCFGIPHGQRGIDKKPVFPKLK
ncbi:MAG: alpha-L-fucosidase [bacterium]